MKLEYESPSLDIFVFKVRDAVMDCSTDGCGSYGGGTCTTDGVCAPDLGCIVDGVCVTDGVVCPEFDPGISYL